MTLLSYFLLTQADLFSMTVSSLFRYTTARMQEVEQRRSGCREGFLRIALKIKVNTYMNNKQSSKPGVLIIDDNINNIEVLAAALTDDYDISFANSGAEGIELAETYRPDLILLDIMMPFMDGFETCRRIRNSKSIHDIPIIFISALEELSDKVKAFQVGGNDYVTKPFQPAELRARVSAHSSLYRTRRELEIREESLRNNLHELETAHQQLKAMSSQLLQSEKLASIGQLAAGVAHEINNPIGFVNSNLTTLNKYIKDLFKIVDLYAPLEIVAQPDHLLQLKEAKQQVDLDFLRLDIFDLLDESIEGIARVRGIVKGLLNIAHPDESEWLEVNLQQLLESTLNVAWSEIKLKAEVVKDYTDLPLVQCLPSQINQVLLNLLINAAQAIEKNGLITLSTRREGDWVSIAVSDNGCGVSPKHVEKIFDPFFTTKQVGHGMGLGLYMSYGIIVKHGGRIEVDSEIDQGSTFTIYLPIRHKEVVDESAVQ
jgi:signal transduction histidine kinase